MMLKCNHFQITSLQIKCLHILILNSSLYHNVKSSITIFLNKKNTYNRKYPLTLMNFVYINSQQLLNIIWIQTEKYDFLN